MSYTLAQIATRALREAGLIAADETASAEDATWAQETITSEVASMRVRGIRIWNGSTSALPDEYFVPLARRIAVPMSASFGLIGLGEAMAARDTLERELRMLGATAPSGAVATAEYF